MRAIRVSKPILRHCSVTSVSPIYIVEDYNAKDLWWGSLPGLFRAATTPPICGFQALEELLAVKDAPRVTTPPTLPWLEELADKISVEIGEGGEYVPT